MAPSTSETVRNRIIELYGSQQFSVQQMAEIVGVSRNTVTKSIAMLNFMDLSNLVFSCFSIANTLSVTVTPLNTVKSKKIRRGKQI